MEEYILDFVDDHEMEEYQKAPEKIWHEVKAAFDADDTNKDGFISMEEMEASYEKSKHPPPVEDSDSIKHEL